MRLIFTILLIFESIISFSQGNKNAVSLSDRNIQSPPKYFDINDPYFLVFFVNAQSTNRTQKLFKEQIVKSKNYRAIPVQELDYFIDSIRKQVYKDTGQLCSTGEVFINQSKAYVALSNYIFWVNNKYWYRVGDNAQNTIEFVKEFMVPEKIKSAAIVTPPPEKNIKCMGKTIAHIYLHTNRKYKFNFMVAKMKLRQVKIGSKWIGHN